MQEFAYQLMYLVDLVYLYFNFSIVQHYFEQHFLEDVHNKADRNLVVFSQIAFK